jgi:hypothetical protein
MRYQIFKRSTLFLLLFVFCPTLFPESLKFPPKTENQLDSLLIAGDFEMANNLLNKSNVQLSSDTKEIYFKFLNEVKKIDTIQINPSHEEKLFEKYRKDKKSFNTENAGEKSNIAYSKFLKFADIDTKQAIKYHMLAHYLKAKYIQNQVQIIEEKIEKAEDLYEDKNFTEASNILNGVKPITENNYKFKAVKDKLDALKEKLMQVKYKEKQHKHLWEQKEKVDHTFKLGIGGVTGSNYPLQREILRRNPGFELSKLGISMRGGLLLNPRFSLSLDLTFTRNSYSSGSLNASPYFFNFHANSSSIQTYLQIFLREETGIRPQINFGLGYLYVTSEAFDAYYSPITEDQGYLLSTSFPARTFNTVQILTEIGAEYISNNNTNFFLESKISAYYNMKETNALGQFNISLSLNIGIVL